MKRALLFLSASILSSIAFSQGPTIRGIYLPVRGTKVKQVWETNNPGMGMPQQDTNVTWDYSNKFTSSLDTFELATYDPADPQCNCSQIATYFPNATHASFLRAPFPFDDSTFTFFRLDTNGVWAVGAYSINSLIKTGGLDTAIVAVDDELFTPASPSYGDSIMDSSRFLIYPGTSSLVARTAHKRLDAVGYGTLKTPVGTFTDVLLAKEVNYRWDTLGAFGTSSSAFVRYYWLRNNTFGSSVLLMQQMLDTSLTSQTNYAWYTLPVAFGSISGSVRDSSGTLVTSCPGCEAYLYRENSNFSIHDILDRSPIDGSGQYQFDSIPYGIYRVAIRPDTILYRNSLTTYYGDTTSWIAADTINTLSCNCNTSGRDITLQYRPGQSNTVALSGSISLNTPYWKNGPQIIPNPLPFAQTIPGVDIIIKKTPGGEANAMVQADGSGNYNVSTLDNGSYEMFVDVPGLFMAGTYTFTVSGATTNNALDFVLGKDSIYPTGLSTGFYTAAATENVGFKVYPNPGNGMVNFVINNQNVSMLNITVTNTLGEVIFSKQVNQSTGTIALDLSSLSTGLYFISGADATHKYGTLSYLKE